jgi:hypothetical protein
MFHVKRPLALKGPLTIKTLSWRTPEEHPRSLADTELPEDHVEDFLDIDSPEQPAKQIGCPPQILRGDLLAAADHLDASLQ